MTNVVIDFNTKRNQAIKEKRREFERVLFQQILGVYSTLEDSGGLIPIQLVDISQKGLLIQIPRQENAKHQYEIDQEIQIRIYFTQKTFLPIICKIKYKKNFIAKNGRKFIRFGCEIDVNTAGYEAMKSFAKFIYKYAEVSVTDREKKLII